MEQSYFQDQGFPTSIKHSNPLNIPANNISKYSIEYNLKKNYFDPNKSSPPNPWNARLLSRIGSFSDLPIKINSLDKK